MRHILIDDKARVETGALKINNDWCGLYIRGDDCIELRELLGQILRGENLLPFQTRILEGYFLEIDRRVLGK